MDILITNTSHIPYAAVICDTIAEAAKARGTGIAKRQPKYIEEKIAKGQAVIALDQEQFAGFCYIESWSHGKFVANSGLIVHPNYQGQGLAKAIKKRIFDHSRQLFPNAKIFSITTGFAVMKMNSALGYQPVPFSELTDEQSFWDGCKTCQNYDVLKRTNQSMCLCTGMLYDPKTKATPSKKITEAVFKRLKQIKETRHLKKHKK
jgi:GNAT superfamily N-acetyltransferase